VSNPGSDPAKIKIKATNTTPSNWTLAQTPGQDTFAMQWQEPGLALNPILSTDNSMFASIAGGSAKTFDLAFLSPTSLSNPALTTTQNTVVTLSAVSPALPPASSYLASVFCGSTAGSADGQFVGSSGIALDSLGNVYVGDINNYRVQKFSSNGTFIMNFVNSGQGDGQVSSPAGICVDDSNNVYVVDSYLQRVQKFSSNGTFIMKWSVSNAWDIAIDKDNNIYVSDYANNLIKKYTSSGVLITQWGSSGTGDGQFNEPRGICVDISGNVFVADSLNARVQKFTSNGTFITKWGSYGTDDGQLYKPFDVVVDDLGYIYICEHYGQRVQKFTPEGGYFAKWPASGFPRMIEIDSSGKIYVTADDKVKLFTPQY
ncbi:MAG: hypothetical protein C0412_21380, partial [Flavobacterium sp.]|nr:hypothetical protein [Flavobacterium sp.]